MGILELQKFVTMFARMAGAVISQMRGIKLQEVAFLTSICGRD
jgi:hypothetical protein